MKNENLYNIIRIGFLIGFILFLLFKQITEFGFLIGNKYIALIFSAIAAILIFWDLVTEKSLFKSKYVCFLIIFLVICFISMLINIRYGIRDNAEIIVGLCIQFFLLYSIGHKKDIKQVKQEIITVNFIVSIVWFVAVTISFGMYLFGVEYYSLSSHLGSYIPQGFSDSRLWGIFTDPNYACILSIVVALMSAMNYRATKLIVSRVFYVVNIIMQIFYVILSGSRTGLVLFMMVGFFAGWYFVKPTISREKFGGFMQELLSVAMAFLVLCGSFALYQGVRFTLPYARYGVELASTIKNGSGNQTANEIDIQPIIRKDMEVKSDVSNGRLSLWKDGFTILNKSPIIGTSPRNISAFAAVCAPNTQMAKGRALHNGFMELLVGSGFIGAIIMLSFLILYIRKIIIYRNEMGMQFYEAGFQFLIIGALAISALFVSDIFFVITASSTIFWLYLGYGMYYIQLANIKK